MIKMLFHQIVGQYRLTYCGCSGDGAGGDAACSSGDGGDSGDSGYTGPSMFGGMEADPAAPDALSSLTAAGHEGLQSTTQYGGIGAVDDWGELRSEIRSNVPEGRSRDSELSQAQEAQWTDADSLRDYVSYGVEHHLAPTLSGLAFGPLAGLATRAGQQYSQGYSPEAIAANAALGLGGQVISQTVGPAVARSTYDALGSKGLAIAAGKGAAAVGKGMLSEAIESGKYSPAETTADTTLADADSTMADETMASLASAPLPSADDAYASAGFGNIRNRQMRSRVRTPLTRG
jgi:hypothetical protein